MSCPRCGAAMSATDAACPSCAAPANAAGERVWAAAQQVTRAARDAERRLRDPALTESLPGRSLAVLGYAALLSAVALDLAPFGHRGRFVSFGYHNSRLGHFWDVLLLLLAVAALAGRLLPQAPRPLTHPALPAALAFLTAGQAYLLLDPSLIPLTLLAAALILVYDAARTGLAAAGAKSFANAVDHLPNATAVGAGLVAAALLLSWTPGRTRSYLGGVVVLGSDPTGTLWGLLVLAGAIAAVALTMLDVPWRDWALGAYVLLIAAWAFVLFNLSLVPLLWLAGAAIAAYDRWRVAQARTGGQLSLGRLTTGPRLLVASGVPLCLLALSFTWSTVSRAGYFMGGYNWYTGGYDLTKYYMPGFFASNTGLTLGPARFSFSPLAVAALLALLVCAVWTPTKPLPAWAYVLPAGLVAALALWTLVHLNGHWGPWVFAGGLGLLGVAAFSVAVPTVREMGAARGTGEPALH